MMQQKKRSDGRYQKAFTFEGKRYYVYGRTKAELIEKAIAKKKELEGSHERREDQSEAKELSLVEKELINSFRCLDDAGRDFILYVLNHEKQRSFD